MHVIRLSFLTIIISHRAFLFPLIYIFDSISFSLDISSRDLQAHLILFHYLQIFTRQFPVFDIVARIKHNDYVFKYFVTRRSVYRCPPPHFQY